MALLLKSVEASRGPRWIGDAFRLYARRPVGFTAMFALFLIAAMLCAVVPLLGGLVQMMSLPLLSLGLMIAGQSVLLGGTVHPRQFFEPLRGAPDRRRAILWLCVIYGVLALATLLLADVVSNSAWQRLQKLIARGDSAQAEIDALLSEPGVTAGALVAVGLGSLLTVPFWHAPALVHWGGQGARQALFSSTVAVWRCKGAFMTYGLAWTGVTIAFLAAATLLSVLVGMPQLAGVLGLPLGLICSTVFYLSVLFTFTDSFGGAPSVPSPRDFDDPGTDARG